MPRDSQGLYTLPAGNPVTSGTLIESAWANSTMNDMAQAMTDSLPRSGSAPMVGPLTLANAPPTNPRHATSKAYVDNFVAYSSGLPIGAIIPWPSVTAPTGFFLCNGQEISGAAYPELFALIGTTFGVAAVGNFKLPDLQNLFIRGVGGSRLLGSTQVESIKSHTHPVTDPGHIHAVLDVGHNHLQNAHNHTAADSGHTHPYTRANIIVGNQGGSSGNNPVATGDSTGSGTANITVANQTPTNIANTTGIGIVSRATGINATDATGGTETVPANLALWYIIKAVEDSTGPVSVLSIDTSDVQAISIDNTLPTAPVLDIHTNVAFGLVKLDATGKIPASLLP